MSCPASPACRRSSARRKVQTTTGKQRPATPGGSLRRLWSWACDKRACRDRCAGAVRSASKQAAVRASPMFGADRTAAAPLLGRWPRDGAPASCLRVTAERRSSTSRYASFSWFRTVAQRLHSQIPRSSATARTLRVAYNRRSVARVHSWLRIPRRAACLLGESVGHPVTACRLNETPQRRAGRDRARLQQHGRSRLSRSSRLPLTARLRSAYGCQRSTNAAR